MTIKLGLGLVGAGFLVAACSSTPAGPPPDTTITGAIADGTTLSGVLALSGNVSVAAGSTVTVAPGTIIEVASGSSIDVAGTLEVMGEKGNIATIESANTGDFWGGIRVEGTYEMHYGKQVGGGMNTNGSAASISVFDSELTDSQGDFVVLDGGTVDIEYTNLGAEDGTNSHCNLHINDATHFTFTHSTNAGSVFGLMFYGGTGDFTHTNWLANDTDIEPDAQGTGSFDNSFFASGLPGGVPGLSFQNMSSTRLTDAGPR